MRRVAGRSIWLGHAGDVLDARGLLSEGIAAVVELGDGEPFASLPRSLVRGRFPLSDGSENPEWLLRLAAETVASLIRARVAVLVCCSAGMSRSVCVASAGVALAEGLSLAEALEVVARAGPVDVSPGLLFQAGRMLSREASTPRG